MGTDVDVFLRRLAQVLRPRVDQSVDVMMQSLRTKLPELGAGKGPRRPLAAGDGPTRQHLSGRGGARPRCDRDRGASRLHGGRPHAARRGVPISKLLRALRLGHVSLLQLMQREATRLTGDLQLVNEATIKLVETAFAYVDRGSEQTVAAYQDERDRRLQRRLILTNEASRRIGTTLDTARTAQELADVGIDDFADLVTVDLLDSVLHEEGTLPPTGAAVLCRIAQRSVLDGCPDSAVATDQTHTYPAESEPAHALATGQPLLHRVTASDLPAWLAPSPDHRDALRSLGFHSALLLPLRARGNTLGLAQFFRHRTTAPFDDDDLLLAQEIAARAAVHIDNARRYTHERSVALTLQRSLLPQRAVEQSAVETASRYLPTGSRAGVGGDWYDVIPLSGARVALVVGDVVGRGLRASATMGCLRTAVRAFADIDLMPDELLTHLDDVVIRLQREEDRNEGEISATFLYAVYDPVSRLCSLASAGHVLPAVATPPATDGDGPVSRSVVIPEMPIGPPLGLGGLPFETTQFELPEGSLLALYTDGLIESRVRDVDTARTMLRDVLVRAPQSLDETCDRLLAALLPSRPSDDVALLLARTRALDPGHVATLDLPSEWSANW